jgi:uncharacterized membrane protein
MADTRERAVLAYFDSAAQADEAAQELMRWDKDDDLIGLDTIGILTKDAEGKLETKNLSARNTGKGALVGLGLGALAAVVSGGLTLLPAAIGGAAGGGLVGSRSKRGLGLSDDDLQQLSAALEEGGAAVLVLCDPHEVAVTTALLTAAGGTVRHPADDVSPDVLRETSPAASAAPAAAAEPAPPAPGAPGAPESSS